MSSFTDPLEVRFIGPNLWETTRDFTYWGRCQDIPVALMSNRCELCITVPHGFRTDFASIPAIAWPLIGHPAGEYAQAAVLHDWLYSEGALPRSEIDWIFLDAMKVLGVSYWKRSLMWLAVRVSGGMFYRKGGTK